MTFLVPWFSLQLAPRAPVKPISIQLSGGISLLCKTVNPGLIITANNMTTATTWSQYVGEGAVVVLGAFYVLFICFMRKHTYIGFKHTETFNSLPGFASPHHHMSISP